MKKKNEFDYYAQFEKAAALAEKAVKELQKKNLELEERIKIALDSKNNEFALQKKNIEIKN